MLVLVIAGKSRSERESTAGCFLVLKTVVVSALEHRAHRLCHLDWQLAVSSSPLDHASRNHGDFGLVDVVSGACAHCVQKARGDSTPALNPITTPGVVNLLR